MGSNYYERRHLYSDSELVACYLKNESQIKAAAELGVSRETEARAVRRAGIKLNGTKHNGKVQLAHMSCNAGKCDRLSGGEQ